MSTAHDWLRRDGMTVREIARALGISSRRVQELENNALRKIRRNPRLLRRLFQFVDFDCSEPPEGATR
jgi:DNA-directed RNA polymerase sigma subunit (sigma70/sigma32)